MKSGSWQGKKIWGMIRTLAVNCAAIVDCSQGAGKTAAETASDEMVMGAARALCELSLLVSQQNHSDLSLAGLDDAPERLHKTMVPFEIRKCCSLRMPKWMNYYQENPIIYENKRFIKSVLQWRFSWMGLKGYYIKTKAISGAPEYPPTRGNYMVRW